jgi:hypothetical protein
MDTSDWFNAISLGIVGGGLLGMWLEAPLGPAVLVLGATLLTIANFAAYQEHGLD